MPTGYALNDGLYMNSRDRLNILDFLEGIANNEPIAFINAGVRLLRDHQKIVDMMEQASIDYWNAMHAGEKFKTTDDV